MKSRILFCTMCMVGGIWAQSLPTSTAGHSSILVLSPSSQGINDLKIFQANKTEVIKGVPYTAIIAKEESRLLSNGNRVDEKSTMFVARDSDGRTFKARLSDGKPLSAAKWKMITDPVLQATYMYVTPRTSSDKTIATRFSNPQGKNEFAVIDNPGDGMPEPPGDTKRESLGSQMMQGVWVEGSHETRTIAAGTVGNEHPFDVTSEEWYSPDLHVVMLKKQNDPRTGETILRLTNIKRVEPDPLLFHVPAEDQTRFDELAIHTHSE